MSIVKYKIKTKFDLRDLRKKVKTANITNLAVAGFFVRREARKKLRLHKKKLVERVVDGRRRKVKEPGEIGGPPRTTGALRNAIKFQVSRQKDDVIIGPDGGDVADVGKAHEFGGLYRGANYPKRPFMAPALEIVKGRLPKIWANSIKS